MLRRAQKVPQCRGGVHPSLTPELGGAAAAGSMESWHPGSAVGHGPAAGPCEPGRFTDPRAKLSFFLRDRSVLPWPELSFHLVSVEHSVGEDIGKPQRGPWKRRLESKREF